MKKGITIVTLVITIIVMGILTGAVLMTALKDDGLMTTTEDTLNNYNKQVMIDNINVKIQTKRLKNLNAGKGSLTVQEDIIPILNDFGTYDVATMKLTTYEKEIEIYLYELINVPLNEFATITYADKVLTVVTTLPANQYTIQYTTNGGNTWQNYTGPITVEDQTGIYVRAVNSEEERKIVSTTVKVAEGQVEEIDTTAPQIAITPNGGTAAKSKTITILATDDKGLAGTNVYEYYISTSDTTTMGGEWKTYTNGNSFTIGEGLTGTYYIHVKEVTDTSGNTSGSKISAGFVFDNKGPNNFTVAVSSKTKNSITVQGTTTDNNGGSVTYYYSANNGSTWIPTNGTTSSSYQITGLTEGTTYQIKMKAIDTLGNVTTSETLQTATLYPADGTYYAAKGVNSPLLAEGMTAVYWNGTTEVTSTNPGDDENFDYNSWYNYEAQTGATTNGGTSKWANAKTADGSYWVWIPRYAYSITSGYHPNTATNTAGTIDVEFLKGTTNTCAVTSRTFVETLGNGYWHVHPAFYYDGTSTTGTQLAGIWVAKYEMSMEETSGAATAATTTSSESIGNVSVVDNTNIKAVSKPGVTAWRYINRSNIFINALNYDTTSVSNANLDSHLMKNSEWGAVAYLAHSKYGRNATEITINDNSSYYTAGDSGATAHTNVLQSTTGNCYGIFDISGCSWEHMAAYMDGASATATPGSNGASLINAASKYKDVYDAPDSTSDYSERNDVRVYGDGIWETSSACYTNGSGTSNAGWYADHSQFVYSAAPFFYRGADYASGTNAGAFAFSYATGGPNGWHSWRVVLWGAL